MKQLSKSITSLFLTLILILPFTLTGCKDKQNLNHQTPQTTVTESPDDLQTTGKTALWEVTSPDSKGKLYLMGTIHVGKRDTFPLRQEIMDAFNKSDYLAVEADITEYETNIQQQIEFAQKCLYSDGTKIYDHISKDTYEKAKKLLSDSKLYSPLFDVYKPCMWNSLIESALIQKTDFNSDYGVDVTLITSAKESGKKILEVESVEFQQDMLEKFSDELYDVMMKESLDNQNEYSDSLQKLYDTWLSGDIKQFIKANEEEEKNMTKSEKKLYDDYNKVMLTDRNKGMADKAEQYLKDGKTVFYAVGFMHMINDDGLVNLLKQKGYTVKAL